MARALLVAALLAAAVPIPARAADPPELTRLFHWLVVVQTHERSRPGTPEIELAQWPAVEVEAVIADVKRLAAFLERLRQKRIRPEAEIQLYNTVLTAERVRAMVGMSGNEILLRGADLHADIATLLPEDFTRRSPDQQGITMVQDGRQQGMRYPTLHWGFGRALLDGIDPSPASDPGVLRWYRSASATQLQTGGLSEAIVHLERARRIFPTDAPILLDSGFLHERFSSPLLQAAAQAIFELKGSRPQLDGERPELLRAERFYRQALDVEAGRVAGRVRLGRVLGQLGRHREAIVELRRAVDAGLSNEWMYLAQLFLGEEEKALGNLDAARATFERAAGLYPRAQSAHLALSQLAREAGDRTAALRVLERLSGLPADERQREDPWWNYFDLR